MNKKSFEKALKELKSNSKERKFKQSFDLIVTLKDLNLKNPSDQIDFFITLNHSLGKKVKVVAFVGPELQDKAERICDETINVADFGKYKDKKLLKKLAVENDFFIAQADIMPKVATTFGRVLGVRGKMPNPKLGTIIPSKGQIEPIVKRLQRTVRISAKKQPMTQVKVGNEIMEDAHVIDNAMQVYDQIVHHLPKEKSNIKNVLIKLTMSKPVIVD